MALNQTTFKIFTAPTAQVKLAIKKIYQVQLAVIKKNPTIINTVKTNFSKKKIFFTIKSLNLLFSKILVSEVAII